MLLYSITHLKEKMGNLKGGINHMEIKKMPVGKVRPYAKNPREINEDAIKAVANSIKQFGFRQPIVVDKDNTIIVGHTRLLAAKLLNLKTVPVLIADELTPEQVKAYRLADNKTGELSKWDVVGLDQELEEIINIDMSAFGFDDVDVDDVVSGNDPSLEDDEEEYECPYCHEAVRKSELIKIGSDML